MRILKREFDRILLWSWKNEREGGKSDEWESFV